MEHIYAAVVRGGVMEGDFDIIEGVGIARDVRTFKERIKASRSRLRDVELGDMTIFGPWATADEVPEDMKEATKGRGCDPATILRDLVGTMERAYFLVRMTAPPSAAAAGASALGRIYALSFSLSCLPCS